jgi:hypothetical protein
VKVQVATRRLEHVSSVCQLASLSVNILLVNISANLMSSVFSVGVK